MAVLYDQAGNAISSTHPLAVALSGTLPLASDAATQTTLAAVLSKITSDPATNATVAAILAKQPASPALEHATANAPSSTRLSDGTTYVGSTAQRLHVSDGGVALKTDGSAVTQPVSLVSVPLATDAASQTTLAAVLSKLSGDPATQTSLLAVLAKLSSDPASQTTLAAILSKLPAAPASEATSSAILSKLIAAPASEATLAAVLAKLIVSPATEATLGSVLAKLSSDPASQSTLAAVLAKLSSDPATGARQDTGNTALTALQGLTQPATTALSATGAAAAAVTLTLPAAGAGLFHYVDYIEVTAYTTAARTGGVTPVVATTTNLPGGLAWTFASAAAVGSTDAKGVAASCPLKASAASTATTIAGPATASVIWRINCVYHTGT